MQKTPVMQHWLLSLDSLPPFPPPSLHFHMTQDWRFSTHIMVAVFCVLAYAVPSAYIALFLLHSSDISYSPYNFQRRH